MILFNGEKYLSDMSAFACTWLDFYACSSNECTAIAWIEIRFEKERKRRKMHGLRTSYERGHLRLIDHVEVSLGRFRVLESAKWNIRRLWSNFCADVQLTRVALSTTTLDDYCLRNFVIESSAKLAIASEGTIACDTRGF